MVLAPKPDFKAIEEKWQNWWVENKIYKFNPRSKKPVFAIDTPPPYISGELHMGHGVSYTGFEFIARYKRMTGHNVLFPIGFDDNGHPTERYVEQKYNIKSIDTPREKFIELCLKETEELSKIAKAQLIKLGHSYDWDLFYSTISPKAVKIAQLSFLDLYSKGLIYKTNQPTLFCTSCQTALSQADVENKTRKTKLYYIDFKIKDSNEKIQIATTRPELLPACVGVFVHPEDTRYVKFVGKTAIVPILELEVPIMQDPAVQKEFGTGVVMICTYGDKTDLDWQRKYSLPIHVIIEKNGKLNQNAGKFVGLSLQQAKEKIIQELKERNFLQKEEDIEQNVGVCWRCKNPIEILLTEQWAIKLLHLKEQLIEIGRQINWKPEYYRKRYEEWVSGLAWDWVISRQRHYGVPMPVWYCENCGQVILPEPKDLPVYPIKDRPKKPCPNCGGKKFKPELDVFDTWMISSLTPQLVRGFTPESIPFDLRPQGYEIIRTWAFYTILKSYLHFGKPPWKSIVINGMILDPQGKAMHKSLGNVINPLDLVEKYGSDALRYFASVVNIGEDAPFMEKELIRAQKLMIKIWNVGKFLELWKVKPKAKFQPKHITDRWIFARLNQILAQYRASFEAYDAVTARRVLEQFFWHEFCDFYLEMIKHRLYSPRNNEEKESAAQTLWTSYLILLKLFAIFFPHLTEEIYSEIYKPFEKTKSIHLTQLPEPKEIDVEALEAGNAAIELIAEIRKYKVSKGLRLGAEVPKLTVWHPYAFPEKILDEVARVTRVQHLHIEKGELKVAED
ncbi:MAG: valine--tRNA ligase [Candidatus Nanoarchaeia archaeon]